MTDPRDDLKSRFNDGKIPSGQDFADLVDAFALDGKLSDLEASFDARFPDGGFRILCTAEDWSITAAPSGALVLGPAEDNAAAAMPPIHLDSAVKAPARIGGWTVDRAARLPAMDTQTDDLPAIDASGTWTQILTSGARTSAWEVVASVETAGKKAGTAPPVRNALRSLLWPSPPDAAVLHAIATCRGGGGAPTLSLTSDPPVPVRGHKLPTALRPAVSLWLLGVLLAGVVMVLPYIDNTVLPDLGSDELEYMLAPLVIALFGYCAARGFAAHRMRDRGLSLRWTKIEGSEGAGTARHALEMRAGPLDGDSGARASYHITRLW